MVDIVVVCQTTNLRYNGQSDNERGNAFPEPLNTVALLSFLEISIKMDIMDDELNGVAEWTPWSEDTPEEQNLEWAEELSLEVLSRRSDISVRTRRFKFVPCSDHYSRLGRS